LARRSPLSILLIAAHGFFLENLTFNLDIWRSYLDAGNKQATINILDRHQDHQKTKL